MERSDGRSSIFFTHGGPFPGRTGRDGSDLVGNWYFWIGCVFRQQTLAGAGNSYGTRTTAHGSVKGSIGTRIQTVSLRFSSRIAPRYSGRPGARLYRVSSISPRPAGIGRYCSGNVVTGASSHVDSGTTRALHRSRDPAARGVNYRARIGIGSSTPG